MRTVAIAGAFAFAAAVLLTGCDKAAPTSPPATLRPIFPPPSPIRRVEITGPQVVDLGATAQFRLLVLFDDGSRRDVTTEARWAAAEEQVRITAPGVVTGLARGEAVVTAEFENRYFGVKHVVVLPAGTYTLTGTVTEAGVPSGPVVGAQVEVTTAAGDRLTARTDDEGTYRLFGVSNETAVRVVKDGYQPVTQVVLVTDRHAVQDIALPLLAPRAEVSGNYTLTITADRRCGAGVGEGRLPEEARVRSHQVTVGQEGPRVEVTPSGANFVGRPFLGRIEPGRVVFHLDWYQEYLPSFVEQLPTSGFLVVDGSVNAAGSGNRLTGLLSATFRVLATNDYYSAPIAWCSSANHQFVLSR